MRTAFAYWIIPALCFCCIGTVAAQEAKTLTQMVQSLQVRTGGSEPSPSPAIHEPSSCPAPDALDLFKQQIAYQRTEVFDPWKGVPIVHANVWQRGPITAFYVRDQLNEFGPGLRMTYLFGKGDLQGGGSCPAAKNWRECVARFAGLEYSNFVAGDCTLALDLRTIPAWKPSPDDEAKKHMADVLRKDIETQWPGVEEIVIRDFNLRDKRITMYLKMPDDDYYESCVFRRTSEPPCSGWSLIGTGTVPNIRAWVFDKPYRLK